MKSKFSFILIVLLFTNALSFANSTLEKKSQELEVVNKKIIGLSSSLNQANSKRHSLQQQLRTIEVSIGQIANDITTINQDLKTEKSELNILNQQHLEYEQQLAQQKLELTLQIRAAYMLGRHQYIKLFLNQKDPQTLARLLMYYQYISIARIKIINELHMTLKKLTKNQMAIKNQSMQYAQLFESKQNQNFSLKQHLQQRKNILVELTKKIQTKSEKLQELKIDRTELQKLIDRLKNQPQPFVKPKIPFAAMKGKLPWPTEGKIIRNFGYRIDASGTVYNGVFISAPMGQPVYAVYSGQVVFSDWLRGVGLLVIIQHDGNFMTLYGHNHSILVKTGEYVQKGQEIATVGKSGGYHTTGLFFQIRKNGDPLNPTDWCTEKK